LKWFIKKFKEYVIQFTRQIGWYWSVFFVSKDNTNFQEFGRKDSHSFMGYYDVDLVFGDSIFFHEVDNIHSTQLFPKRGKIVKANLISGDIKEVTSTRAINWQLGSRLQKTGNSCILFNDINMHNQLISRELNFKSNKITEYPFPLWAILPKKNYGMIIDFSVLGRLRPGYGYDADISEIYKNKFTIASLSDHSTIFSISTKDIEKNLGLDTGGYFNHAIYSPNENYVLTTYNYNTSSSRKVSPIIIDLESMLFTVPKIDGIFSHPTFIDDNTLLFFDGEGYCKYQFKEDRKEYIYKTKNDGHPTPSDKNSFITDTYPDRFGRMRIYRFHKNENALIEIINYPSYKSDFRCDLHPRLIGDMVFFDVPKKDGRKVGLHHIN